MKPLFRSFFLPGIKDNHPGYIACKIRLFNYFNIGAFITGLVRFLYLIFLSPVAYTNFTLLVNLAPFLVSLAMFISMSKKKYHLTGYISFIFFPPLLYLVYAATHDSSVAFYMGLYLIFPFFFIEKGGQMTAAFIYASAWMIMVVHGASWGFIFYDRGFYPSDMILSFFDIIISLLMVFGVLHTIKSIIINYQEKSIKKTGELKQSNELKDKLISIISHDVRTPLASTSQLLDFISDNKLEEDEFNYYIDELKKMVDNTRGMMDNLLAWTRSQMKNDTVVKAEVDIKRLTEEVMAVSAKAAADKNITISNKIDDDVLAYADTDTIRIIILNLVNNAIKFTKEGGRIELGAEAYNKDRLVFKVKDNGMGISGENKNKVLGDGFFTSPGTAEEKGTGIGLKICRDLAIKNDGSLYFESLEGKGTTFFLDIPRFRIRKEVEKALNYKLKVVALAS